MGGPLGTGSCTSPVHPHSGAALGRPSGAQRCVRDTRVPNRRRRVYVGVMKAKAKTPPRGGGRSGSPYNFFPARQAASLWLVALWVPALAGPPPQERGRSPTAAAPIAPPASMCRGVAWARWGYRSPGTDWSPAPMESVDRWPLASPDTQIPGGSRPAGAAVRRRVRGAGPLTRGPYAAGHTAPARADWWNTLRADRCLRGYSGGNWMATFSRPPGAPGACRGGRALVRPFQFITELHPGPFGGSGPPGTGAYRFTVARSPGVVTKLSG